jgi:hypothetical protein
MPPRLWLRRCHQPVPQGNPNGILSRAVTKVRARDRAQLVVIAYQTALVSPEEMSGNA